MFSKLTVWAQLELCKGYTDLSVHVCQREMPFALPNTMQEGEQGLMLHLRRGAALNSEMF